LLSKLDGGDEVDRAALLSALGGVLARVPSDVAVHRLASALELAAGPERDGVIEALGRAPLPSAVNALGAVAERDEPADRRGAAALLAAHPGDAAALAAARALLDDGDSGVRAQAAWTLGTLGDPSDVARLAGVARSPDVDAAPNAVAAIGRITARANALAGLGLAGARCSGGGAAERAALSEDPSEDARAAAALLLSRAPSVDDARALERCARSDPSGTVAARCRSRASTPARVHPALVYVVAETATQPHPGAPYAMLLADGLVHAGTTDRRGAVFDPVAPEGDVSLRRPSALAR
jgi:HEAT repeat protein